MGGGAAEGVARAIQRRSQLARVRALGARRDHDAFKARLGGVDAATERVPGNGARVVQARGLFAIAAARRQLRLESAELRARDRRQLRALADQRLDAGARARQSAEIEVGVRQVEQRRQDGGAPPRAAPHVHGGLEVLDGSGDVAAHLEQAGEVQLERREHAGVGGALGGVDAATVGVARLVHAVVALRREPGGRQGDRLHARRAGVARALDGALERRARRVVPTGERLGEALEGERLGAEATGCVLDRSQQREGGRVLAGADVGARHVERPRLALRRITALLYQRFRAAQTIQRPLGFPEAELEARFGDGALDRIRVAGIGEGGARVVEATAIEMLDGALERAARGLGRRAAEQALDVALRRHGLGRDQTNQPAELAGTRARYLDDARLQVPGERGNRVAHEIDGGARLERRHGEHARARSPAHEHEPHAVLARAEHARPARVVEGVGVVDQQRDPGKRRLGDELGFDRRRRVAQRLVDPAQRCALDAQGPRDAPQQRAAPGARRPFDRQRLAGAERFHLVEQHAGRHVDVDDRPERGVLQRLVAASEARGAPERARELVGGREARRGILLGGPRRDGLELAQHRTREPYPAALDDVRQRDAEGVHLRAHRERLALEQLRRGVLRREALRRRSRLAPGRREPEIDERRAAAGLDDDVGGLDVAVEQPCTVQHRQLFGRARQRVAHPRRVRTALDQILQTVALDQLAQHERASALRQSAEAHDARHAEPLEAAERDGLAYQRRAFALARAFRQHLERQARAGVAIPHRPDLSAAALSQGGFRFIAIRKLYRGHKP